MYFKCYLISNLDINGATTQNSAYDSKQLPYSRTKMREKVLNKLQSKFVLCKLTICKHL